MSQNEDAQRSTGPVTAEGKFIVSQNAIKHGLTGTTHTALAGEEAALAKYIEGYRTSYAPVGLAEADLVRTLAEHNWRLRRAHAMERAMFARTQNEADPVDSPDAALANAWIDPKKGLQRIALYANRIQKAIEKTTKELNTVQEKRQAAYAKAKEEAMLLTELADSQGFTWDPGEHFGAPGDHGGFVYSRDVVRNWGRYKLRLDAARKGYPKR